GVSQCHLRLRGRRGGAGAGGGAGQPHRRALRLPGWAGGPRRQRRAGEGLCRRPRRKSRKMKISVLTVLAAIQKMRASRRDNAAKQASGSVEKFKVPFV